jgi:uncharacterized membrane protein YedE/YeeE
MKHRHPLATFPYLTPASAGVLFGFGWRGAHGATSPSVLFSREGGSPVWVPAFAGTQWGARTPALTC